MLALSSQTSNLMKKITFVVLLLFTFFNSHAQIPSVKQASRRVAVPVDKDFIIRIDGAPVSLTSDYRFLKIQNAQLESQLEISKQREQDIYNEIAREGTSSDRETALDSIKTAIASIETNIKNNLTNLKKVQPEGFWPSWGKKKEDFYYMLYSKDNGRDFYFVNNAALQVNDEANSVQSEITSAYMGPLRLSFGSLLSNSASGEEGEPDPEEPEVPVDDTEAFQRLLSGGGNIYLNMELPVWFMARGPWVGYINANAKGAADFSAISNDIDTSTANGSVGLNAYTSISTDENEFNFFGNVTYGMYIGGNEFYRALAIGDEKPFAFGQLTAGVTIFNKFRFSFTTNTFSSEENLRSGKLVFGIQVLSGFFEN